MVVTAILTHFPKRTNRVRFAVFLSDPLTLTESMYKLAKRVILTEQAKTNGLCTA